MIIVIQSANASCMSCTYLNSRESDYYSIHTWCILNSQSVVSAQRESESPKKKVNLHVNQKEPQKILIK